jgi:hypothetical protein
MKDFIEINKGCWPISSIHHINICPNRITEGIIVSLRTRRVVVDGDQEETSENTDQSNKLSNQRTESRESSKNCLQDVIILSLNDQSKDTFQGEGIEKN